MGLAPGAVKVETTKYRATYAYSYCGWTFSLSVDGWSDTPVVTVVGTVS